MRVFAEGDRVFVRDGCGFSPGRIIGFDESIGVGRDLPAAIDVDLDDGGKVWSTAVRLAVPCKHCGSPTMMHGTRMCDGCWELDHRIRAEPKLAASILLSIITKSGD